MKTSTCPRWCEVDHPEWDDVPDGHDGPRFGEVTVGVAFGDPLSIYTEEQPSRTPDQAREFASDLYRAAAWVEDHRED